MTDKLRTYDFSTKDRTIEAIRQECAAQGLTLAAQIAYVLATVEWETAHTMEPVKEGLKASDNWRKRHLRYFPYYGRGFVQITWERNYKFYSDLLGIDMIDDPKDPTDDDDPDRALDPNVALFILVHGFKNGVFTGKKLTDYIDVRRVDFINARRCINGTDRAREIARLADAWLAKLNG